MNYGIINNRRPDPRQRGGTSSVSALLADPRMREIAKQMGLQPKDFGEEAQALWQTLNDLSTSDPKRYESFINEQLQDGPRCLRPRTLHHHQTKPRMTPLHLASSRQTRASWSSAPCITRSSASSKRPSSSSTSAPTSSSTHRRTRTLARRCPKILELCPTPTACKFLSSWASYGKSLTSAGRSAVSSTSL